MIKLPTSFVFGIAESDLQTVGSILPQKHENAQKTMWEQFANAKKIDAPLYSSFKYDRAAEDAELIAKLRVKAYRTSVSMSRILDKQGNVNKQAITWYRNYLQSLKSHGIEVHLCLYHWEAPEQFLEQGILDPQFQDYFLKHTAVVLEHLSDLVDYFIPMNELWCMAYLSYFVGIHAPGYKDLKKFFQAYINAVELQTKVIKAIKLASNNAKVGIVNIHFPTYIQSQFADNPQYLQARHYADHITNYMYSDPFFMGTIDEQLIETYTKVLPDTYQTVIAEAKLPEAIDYYGVNYYNSMYVKPAANELGYELDFPESQLTNSLGWAISLPPHYPTGLTDILVSYTQRYYSCGLKRLVVSENGTPLYTNSQKVKIPDDNFRIFFIQEHLKQIQEAIAKGAIVDGYFLWTLLDNYEWQEGFKPEGAFGIVAVNRKTGKRIPKKSYYWYQQFLKEVYGN